MAMHPDGYGFTAEVKDKISSKYDLTLAREAGNWIKFFVKDANWKGDDEESVHETLKDGIILCKLINALQPGSVKTINSSKMAFQQMENIGNFISGSTKYGVKKEYWFATVDLYEAENMAQVVLCLHALARKAASKGERGIRPKESE
ncbi:unnamed protein product [Owenia fusiformis]|uniref:Uncharacterized protein n=1 Tax=Owenia fusiformis TaxID=6347 RepID=A0A8J1XXT5_OWEFU|nr:unnamed protein product [Owenia fusiformis]